MGARGGVSHAVQERAFDWKKAGHPQRKQLDAALVLLSRQLTSSPTHPPNHTILSPPHAHSHPLTRTCAAQWLHVPGGTSAAGAMCAITYPPTHPPTHTHL